MIPPEFGATPWGKAWVRTIESTAASTPNTLLPRARSLARSQTVHLVTKSGHIDAHIADHHTSITVPPWPTQDLATTLTAEALSRTTNLAPGDLPDTLETTFRHNDITIAAPLGDLTYSCDCRTRKRPCVHVLATIYALSQQIDERPLLAVELRSSSFSPTADTDWIPLTTLNPAQFYG